MYIPKHFEETRVEVLNELIRAYPLATLITHTSAGLNAGLNANHIPLYLCDSPAPHGKLIGHIARLNPLAADIGEGIETLAIFHGPNSYITPSWYPTKRETGKVVPTWNYAVVHVYGQLRAVEDPSWVRAQLDTLTDEHESAFSKPWAVSDAPPQYIESMMGAIVGIEIEITKVLGKMKVSQNQPAANQVGVVEGLREQGKAGECMARMVEGGEALRGLK